MIDFSASSNYALFKGVSLLKSMASLLGVDIDYSLKLFLYNLYCLKPDKVVLLATSFIYSLEVLSMTDLFVFLYWMWVIFYSYKGTFKCI